MSYEDTTDPTKDPQNDDQSASDDQTQDDTAAAEPTPPAADEAQPEAEAAPAAEATAEAAPAADGDQSLNCEDCSSEFTFTAGEQEFYTEKGFTPPKRCPSCRQAKKERSREVSEVTCAECGKPTTVPFVPTSDRPVYCRECFETKRS